RTHGVCAGSLAVPLPPASAGAPPLAGATGAPDPARPLARARHARSPRPPARAAGEVEAVHAGGGALAAQGRAHGLDGLQRATDHARAHTHQAPAAAGLAPLGLEPRRLRPPARRGGGPWAWRRDGWPPWPSWVRNAVRASRNPAVSNRGAPSGAPPCATW